MGCLLGHVRTVPTASNVKQYIYANILSETVSTLGERRLFFLNELTTANTNDNEFRKEED